MRMIAQLRVLALVLALLILALPATPQTNSGAPSPPEPTLGPSSFITPPNAVLWWTDRDLNTDVIPGGIALAGMTAVHATSGADFVNKLDAGGWQAVILGEQNFALSAALMTAVHQYLDEGGRLIGATFYPTTGSPSCCAGSTSVFPGLMQAQTVATNLTPITTSAHPIFAGLGATIALANPGWVTYDQSLSPLAGTGAVGLGTLGTANAVILGHNGHTLLNGPLFDTYATVAQGQGLIANELNFLMLMANGVPLGHITHTWNALDPTTPGVFVSNGTASTWAAPKTFPGATPDAIAHGYFTSTINVQGYNFVYVLWTETATNTVVFAYQVPFTGGNATHYLGDAGVSPPPNGRTPGHAAFEVISVDGGQIFIVGETTGALTGALGATIDVEVLGFTFPNCGPHATHLHFITNPPDLHDHDSHAHIGQHNHHVIQACAANPLKTGDLNPPLPIPALSAAASERLSLGDLPALAPPFAGALNQDGNVNGSGEGQSAPRGTVVQLFGSAAGLYVGQEHGLLADRFTPPASGSPLYWSSSLPTVRIGTVQAQVLFSGLAPGLKGVWQINVLIPADAPSGQVPVNISYEGDVLSPLFINVK